MARYYDKGGNPITMLEWESRFESATYKRVAFDTVGAVDISTVWLGLDDGYTTNAPPMIFETMVFGGEHDGHQERYSTLAEAITGHAGVVALVTKGRQCKSST